MRENDIYWDTVIMVACFVLVVAFLSWASSCCSAICQKQVIPLPFPAEFPTCAKVTP